jgi:hypothetical protein
MITKEQAEQIASQVTGRQDGSWELVEFDDGWLIRESSASDRSLRGGVTRVIERDSGRVVRFPSSVSPRRIVNEYAQVVDRGRAETPA